MIVLFMPVWLALRQAYILKEVHVENPLCQR